MVSKTTRKFGTIETIKFEDPNIQVAEVVASFAGSVLDVAHVGQSRSHRNRYLIGESDEANFKVPGADLPNPAASPLVSRDADGYALTFTPSMRGSVEFGGVALSLADLVASGRARVTDGAHRFVLPSGAKAKVMFGDVRFDIALVHRGCVVAGRGEIDRPFWGYFGGTATLGTVLYLLMRSMPEDALAMQQAEYEASMRLITYLPQVDEQKVAEPIGVDDTATGEQAGDGQTSERVAGPSRRASAMKSRSTDGPTGPVGPRRVSASMSRNFDLGADASKRGILGMIPSQDRFLAYSGLYTVGAEDTGVWSNAAGVGYLAASGPGGTDLAFTPKGGDTASGVLDMDARDLVGCCGGSRDSHGSKRGASGFGPRKEKVPTLRIEKDDASGPLEKDMIRRFVRGHLNEIRHCYNEGLSRNPQLEGRVTVQFTITGTGTVAAAVVQENGTNDSKVASCIAGAIKRWKFPRAQSGGTTMVTYPFMLTAM